jgi:hypothetical protein
MGRTQIWTDNENNIKILFTYSPDNPVVDIPTELKFDVRNALTNNSLQDLTAMVVLLNNSSGQERTFKFDHMPIVNGRLSLKYRFFDPGMYQLFIRINSSNPPSITLASFRIIVIPATLCWHDTQQYTVICHQVANGFGREFNP